MKEADFYPNFYNKYGSNIKATKFKIIFHPSKISNIINVVKKLIGSTRKSITN